MAMSSQALAVPGPNEPQRGRSVRELTISTENWSAEKVAAAAMFARGLSRPKIVRRFVDFGFDETNVRRNLRRWKKDPLFGDFIWQLVMVDMDLAAPTVVMGMLKKAQRGDVAAAKFFLELIGRYTPKPEAITASQINLVLPESINRPTRSAETFGTETAAEIRAEIVDTEPLD